MEYDVWYVGTGTGWWRDKPQPGSIVGTVKC